MGIDEKRRAHLKKMYSELTNDQLREEIRWRSSRPWTSHMISGSDCMVVPTIKGICREILRERGAVE